MDFTTTISALEAPQWVTRPLPRNTIFDQDYFQKEPWAVSLSNLWEKFQVVNRRERERLVELDHLLGFLPKNSRKVAKAILAQERWHKRFEDLCIQTRDVLKKKKGLLSEKYQEEWLKMEDGWREKKLTEVEMADRGNVYLSWKEEEEGFEFIRSSLEMLLIRPQQAPNRWELAID